MSFISDVLCWCLYHKGFWAKRKQAWEKQKQSSGTTPPKSPWFPNAEKYGNSLQNWPWTHRLQEASSPSARLFGTRSLRSPALRVTWSRECETLGLQEDHPWLLHSGGWDSLRHMFLIIPHSQRRKIATFIREKWIYLDKKKILWIV